MDNFRIDRWYHIEVQAYGTWIPGDRRGFRARHHRKHVEGDYKRPPPPERDAGLRRHVAANQRHPSVSWTLAHRRLICTKIVESLRYQGCTVASVAITRIHGHAVVQTPEDLHVKDPPRSVMGKAKAEATKCLRAAGFFLGREVWAIRCGVDPIEDRCHQINAVNYDRDHRFQGGVVWTGKVGFEDPLRS